jgi:hypothetical protein
MTPSAVQACSTQRIDKLKLPSRHVTVGPERATHRSFFYAMGVTEAQLAQPLVGEGLGPTSDVSIAEVTLHLTA